MAATEALLNAFTTLLVTTDPPGLAPIFLGLTVGMTAAQRRQTALRGTLIAFCILAAFALTGARVLSVLGISLPAFRISGGFLLFFIAFEMIFEKRQERKEKTTEVAITRDHIHNLAVFPLAIPLISGPGSISATILLAGNLQQPLQRVELLLVIATVFVLIYAALLVAHQIDRVLGQTGRAILTQAVLEGVSFAFRDNLEALKSAGTSIARLTAIGGGSRSRYWLKSIATALDVPVDIPTDGDFGGAFGAARLGLIAATGADPVAVCTPPATEETIEPDQGLRSSYEGAYQRYRALYPALSALSA
eukprot:gene40013-54097_t